MREFVRRAIPWSACCRVSGSGTRQPPRRSCGPARSWPVRTWRSMRSRRSPASCSPTSTTSRTP
ncbi:hypothetical protein NKH77_52710 [Streptomyces sp. M19]